MSAQSAIRAALEALEVGDQRLATAILLDALEDSPRPTAVHCPHCDQRFAWPGLLKSHLLHAHAAPVLRPAPPPRRLLRTIPRGAA